MVSFIRVNSPSHPLLLNSIIHLQCGVANHNMTIFLLCNCALKLLESSRSIENWNEVSLKQEVKFRISSPSIFREECLLPEVPFSICMQSWHEQLKHMTNLFNTSLKWMPFRINMLDWTKNGMTARMCRMFPFETDTYRFFQVQLETSRSRGHLFSNEKRILMSERENRWKRWRRS